MRTQVGIIGAGPAGLFLSHLLHQAGIECVVLEARSRAHLESRVRAGVLEPGTVETMQALGVDHRMKQSGMVDRGLDMRFRGRTIHLDLPGLTGKSVMIYGQQEVVKDLVAARLAAGQPLLFETAVTVLDGLDGIELNGKSLAGPFVAQIEGHRASSNGHGGGSCLPSPSRPHLEWVLGLHFLLCQQRLEVRLSATRQQYTAPVIRSNREPMVANPGF